MRARGNALPENEPMPTIYRTPAQTPSTREPIVPPDLRAQLEAAGARARAASPDDGEEIIEAIRERMLQLRGERRRRRAGKKKEGKA